MSTFHHYAAGKPPVERPDARDMDELQAQVDDLEKTKRIDAILWERRFKK